MSYDTGRLGRRMPSMNVETFRVGRLLEALGSHYGATEDCPEYLASHDELAQRGLPMDGRRAFVPWGALVRDLGAATGSAGGYLAAGTSTPSFAATLRQYSVLADGGARVFTPAAGSIGIPSFSTPLAASWLATEGDAVSESDPIYTAATGSAKMLATPPVDVSRRLLKQQPDTERLLRAEILTAIGKALDAAAVNGTGSNGQPTGALVASGTISQSGTTLAHSGLVAMLRQVMATGVRRDRIRWLCDPLAFATLSGRERASGSGYIIDGFQACGLPVDVTSGMPANSLLCLDPADISLVLWQPGVVIRANPFANSTSGAVRFDCALAADVVIPVPGRIAKSTSIT